MVQPQKVGKAEIIWVGAGIRENCHQFGCNLVTTLVALLRCRNSHNHTFSYRCYYPRLPEFQDLKLMYILILSDSCSVLRCL